MSNFGSLLDGLATVRGTLYPALEDRETFLRD